VDRYQYTKNIRVRNRATVRSRADSRSRDHMACAQARTISVRAAALPSQSNLSRTTTFATTVTWFNLTFAVWTIREEQFVDKYNTGTVRVSLSTYLRGLANERSPYPNQQWLWSHTATGRLQMTGGDRAWRLGLALLKAPMVGYCSMTRARGRVQGDWAFGGTPAAFLATCWLRSITSARKAGSRTNIAEVSKQMRGKLDEERKHWRSDATLSHMSSSRKDLAAALWHIVSRRPSRECDKASQHESGVAVLRRS
jgi:hypothetical protein